MAKITNEEVVEHKVINNQIKTNLQNPVRRDFFMYPSKYEQSNSTAVTMSVNPYPQMELKPMSTYMEMPQRSTYVGSLGETHYDPYFYEKNPHLIPPGVTVSGGLGGYLNADGITIGFGQGTVVFSNGVSR